MCLWHTGPPRSELQGVDHDCNDIPDAAMTLAVAALFAKGSTRIRNVYNWRVKACSSPLNAYHLSLVISRMESTELGTWERRCLG